MIQLIWVTQELMEPQDKTVTRQSRLLSHPQYIVPFLNSTFRIIKDFFLLIKPMIKFNWIIHELMERRVSHLNQTFPRHLYLQHIVSSFLF